MSGSIPPVRYAFVFCTVTTLFYLATNDFKYTVVEHWWSDNDREVFGENPVPVPLFLQSFITSTLNGGKCGQLRVPAA